ncbi:hypothetical protein F4777DRAFT_546544 [Nemania sp. FL0916]|nr:hypothetical protein F4777DRAFT_546544 [Nemania sp. FL0916]
MDRGIHVLYEPDEGPYYNAHNKGVDIVAIHGIGAHPDLTWIGRGPHSETVHWLRDPKMLPKSVPNARIMRFGYQSGWWSPKENGEPKKTFVNDVAEMLLRELEFHRYNITRPIIFIAHSYGGLVLIHALRRSFDDPAMWSNPFRCTAGLIFFGTPFRGRFGLSLKEMVEAIAKRNPEAKIYSETMALSVEENPYLRDIVYRYTETRRVDHPIPLCCFYETDPSPIGKMLRNNNIPDGYLVPEPSACLDLSKGVSCCPLERHHYNLQKFPGPSDPAYRAVESEIAKMCNNAWNYLKDSSGGVSVGEADEWICKRHYATHRLRVERLSGDKLPIDHCCINLAIVEKQDFGTVWFKNPSTTLQEIEKPEDDIHVELAKIFDQREKSDGSKIQPRRILIRGQPGVGKTTLCKKIVHDFVYSDTWKNLFDRILWVPLRTLKTKPGKDYDLKALLLRDFFFDTPKREQLATKLELALQKTKYARTLFVLDGLDEISEGLVESSEMYRFLEFLLKKPNVIVTCRPSTGLPDYLTLDLKLDILGFSSNQIARYLEGVFKSTQATQQVKSFLIQHGLINNLARIPTQLDALCYIWDKTLKDTTHPLWTKTSIYQAIEENLWKKDLQRLGRLAGRKPEQIRLIDMKPYLGPLTTLLERLAFDGLYHNMVEFRPGYRDAVFQGADLGDYKFTLDELLEKISFLHNSDPSVDSSFRSYHFLHLTYQEFFAAKYFVRQWQNKSPLKYLVSENKTERAEKSPVEFLREFKYNPRYDLMWRFVAGLLGRDFFTTIDEKPLDLLGPVHQRLVIRCLSETDPSALPGTRLALETRLTQWLLFECHLRRNIHLASESEFPIRALHTALDKSDVIHRHAIIGSLRSRIRDVPIETIEHLKDLLKDADDGHMPSLINSLRNQTDSPDTTASRLVEQLYHASGRDRSAIIKALGTHLDVPEPTMLRLLSLPKNADDIRERAAIIDGLRSRTISREPTVDGLVALLENPGSRDKSAIIKTLGNHPDLPESTVISLITLLEDAGVRTEAARTIGQQSTLSMDAVTKLVAQIEHNTTPLYLYMTAVENQSNLPEPAVSILMKLIGNTATAENNTIIIQALQTPQNLPEEAAPLLKALASNDKDKGDRVHDHDGPWAFKRLERDRERAAKILKKQSSLSNKNIAMLWSLIEFADKKTKHLAAKILKRQSKLSEQITMRLIRLFESQWENDKDNWRIVHKALTGQTNLPQQAVSILLQLLEDAHFSVRGGAARILARQSREVDTTTLNALSRSSNPSIQYTAAVALRQQSNLSIETIAAFTQLLKDDDQDLRRHAAEALDAQSNLTEKACATLVQLLGDNDIEVQDSVEKILGCRPNLPTNTIEALIELFQNNSDYPHIKAAIILSKQSRLPKGSVTTLVGMLEVARSDDLNTIVGALENEGPLSESNTEVITRLFENGNKSQRSAALQVLGGQSNLPDRTITVLTTQLGLLNSNPDRWLGPGRVAVFLERLIAGFDSDPLDKEIQANITAILKKQPTLSHGSIVAVVSTLKGPDSTFRSTIMEILANKSDLPKDILELLVPLLADKKTYLTAKAAEVLGSQSKLPKEIVTSIIELLEEMSQRGRFAVAEAIEDSSMLLDKILDDSEVFSSSEVSSGERPGWQSMKKISKRIRRDKSRTPAQTMKILYPCLLHRSFREHIWLQVNEDLTLSLHDENGVRTTSWKVQSEEEVLSWRQRLNDRGYEL